jgi:hypothetical protein
MRILGRSLFNDGAKRASKEDIVLFDNRWLMGGTD